MSLLRHPVLQLNASYEPMRLLRGRRAVELVLKGVAKIEVSRGVDLRPGLPMPSVIRLYRYVRVPVRMKVVNRRNVFMRDRYTCMYCGNKFSSELLTWDHVLPKSRGGRDEWDNLVTCCKRCNHRKGDRTPEEAGMPLLRRPLPRTVHTGRFILRMLGEEYPEWDEYLFRNSDGETKLVHRA